MKFKYSFIAIAALLLTVGVLWSCEDSNEDPVKERGTYVVPNLEFTSAPVFIIDKLTEGFIDLSVTLNEGDVAESGSIEVTLNGEKPVIMQDFSSFPAQIHITATDIVAKMGVSVNEIESGDVFTFSVLTKKNGVTTRSVAYGNVKVLCPYSSNVAYGSYYAVSSDWDVEGEIELTIDEEDQFKIYVSGLEDMDGVSGVDQVFFQIDPNSFTISNKDAFILSEDLEEDWGEDYHGYTNYTYKIVKGDFNSCNGTYVVTFNISCGAGDFGNYVFEFKRQN